MKCSDCVYYWREDGDDYPSCKWEPKEPGDMAPCEYDESEEDY